MSRTWEVLRETVTQRDDDACQYCAACEDGDAGAKSTGTDLRIVPVGPLPASHLETLSSDRSGSNGGGLDRVHESAFTTVCSDCFTARSGTLDDDSRGASLTIDDPDVLFDIVRSLTRAQGRAVSTAAELGSVATSLPSTLREGSEPPYAGRRRALLLALDVVEGYLDGVSRADVSSLDAPIEEPLTSFLDVARTLQEELTDLLTAVERTVAALDRCHGCFAPDGRSPVPERSVNARDGSGERPHESACGVCERTLPDVSSLTGEDGVDFERAFATIDNALRRASASTDATTERATELATAIVTASPEKRHSG